MDENEISLQEALAWVYSRDLEFLRFVGKQPYQPLVESFSAFQKLRDEQFEPVSTGRPEAWRLLQAEIVSGKLELWGVRFTAGQKQQFRTVAGERFMVPPPARITGYPVETFFLEDRPDEVVLYFAGNRSLGEAWWRHVQLDRGALMEAFPNLPLNPKHVKRKTKLLKKSSVPYLKIEEAVNAIWPDGRIMEKRTARNNRIRGWWRERGDSLVGLSPTTIDRYFSENAGEK